LNIIYGVFFLGLPWEIRIITTNKDTPLTMANTHTKNSYPLYGKTYGWKSDPSKSGYPSTDPSDPHKKWLPPKPKVLQDDPHKKWLPPCAVQGVSVRGKTS
jgi:hypothetical protein